MNAVWISQLWKCVQQNAGRSHEGSGKRLLVIIPGWYPDFHWGALGTLRTFSPVSLAHVVAGIKIKPCKTKLFQSEVEYLGHKITKGGVSMIPEYMQKIKD